MTKMNLKPLKPRTLNPKPLDAHAAADYLSTLGAEGLGFRIFRV